MESNQSTRPKTFSPFDGIRAATAIPITYVRKDTFSGCTEHRQSESARKAMLRWILLKPIHMWLSPHLFRRIHCECMGKTHTRFLCMCMRPLAVRNANGHAATESVNGTKGGALWMKNGQRVFGMRASTGKMASWERLTQKEIEWRK